MEQLFILKEQMRKRSGYVGCRHPLYGWHRALHSRVASALKRFLKVETSEPKLAVFGAYPMTPSVGLRAIRWLP